jgi:hypothetical protein
MTFDVSLSESEQVTLRSLTRFEQSVTELARDYPDETFLTRATPHIQALYDILWARAAKKGYRNEMGRSHNG